VNGLMNVKSRKIINRINERFLIEKLAFEERLVSAKSVLERLSKNEGNELR